ncbi:response regulator transcription factor [Novipirellula caenicola]|uniref:Transcriptional regulatory protein LiaR n=1 Tax=Novipirellula caenicola TaxID=1536901 RepID=A0ABP9VYU8_9BACT
MSTSAPITPLRLLLIDDHSVMRAGLANMLNVRPEFEVVAEAGDGETGLELHHQHAPDVTLLDITMPGMGGINCLKRIKQQVPNAKVLILSSSEIESDMRQVIQLGASGYMLKSALPGELVVAIQAVGRGEKSFANHVLRKLECCSITPTLTPRETEVLHLLRKGMSNPDIGMTLQITPRTAKAHVAAILVKLEAHDRAAAVARGFELGLLRP